MKRLWLCIILTVGVVSSTKESPLTTNYSLHSISEIKYADFRVSYNKLRKEEGYYVNDPVDLGKETYAGITKKHNKDWLGWYYVESAKLTRNQRVTGQDSLITELLVLDFYLDIWVKEGFYKLTNQDVADYLFDMRVHMYRTQTIKLLNKTFNFTQDKKEVEWVKQSYDYISLNRLRKARTDYYLSLIKRKPSQVKFKKNWIKRASR